MKPTLQFQKHYEKDILTLSCPVNSCLWRLALSGIIMQESRPFLLGLFAMVVENKLTSILQFAACPQTFSKVPQTVLIKKSHVFIVAVISSGNKDRQVLLQRWRGDLLSECTPTLGQR